MPLKSPDIVLNILAQLSPKPATPSEIDSLATMRGTPLKSKSALWASLSRLAKQGKIKREGHGSYKFVEMQTMNYKQARALAKLTRLQCAAIKHIWRLRMLNQPKYQHLTELQGELKALHPVIKQSLESGFKDKRKLLDLRNAVTAALALIEARSYEAARVCLRGVDGL